MSARHLSSQPENGRRDKLAILSAISSCADKGVFKTELMYKVVLCSSQADRYLHMLVTSGLLDVFNDTKKPFYRTTKKGKRYVETFLTLVEFLDAEKPSRTLPLLSSSKP